MSVPKGFQAGVFSEWKMKEVQNMFFTPITYSILNPSPCPTTFTEYFIRQASNTPLSIYGFVHMIWNEYQQAKLTEMALL